MLIFILRYLLNPHEYYYGIYYGLTLVISYNLLDVISNLITDQSDFVQSIIGINAKHGLTGIIYDKAMRISQSTNKKFSQGEIINFINVDVEKLRSITSNLSNAAKLPFQLIFGLGFLFYYFTFLLSSSLIFGILFIILNLLIGLARGIIQKKVYYEKDKRMTITNELISNIKIVKLNSLAIKGKSNWHLKINKIIIIFKIICPCRGGTRAWVRTWNRLLTTEEWINPFVLGKNTKTVTKVNILNKKGIWFSVMR